MSSIAAVSFLSMTTRVAEGRMSAVLVRTSDVVTAFMRAARALPHAASFTSSQKCAFLPPPLYGVDKGGIASRHSLIRAKVTVEGG